MTVEGDKVYPGRYREKVDGKEIEGTIKLRRKRSRRGRGRMTKREREERKKS